MNSVNRSHYTISTTTTTTKLPHPSQQIPAVFLHCLSIKVMHRNDFWFFFSVLIDAHKNKRGNAMQIMRPVLHCIHWMKKKIECADEMPIIFWSIEFLCSIETKKFESVNNFMPFHYLFCFVSFMFSIRFELNRLVFP